MYTCDLLNKDNEDELVYAGFKNLYSCFCNQDDYNIMPPINFEITDMEIQFDVEPEDYMLLPYLNYTVPMSLCILGLDEAPARTLADGDQYASLGQRALSSMPFYAVYD